MATSSPPSRTIGLIEGCTPWQVRGWVFDPDQPLLAAELLLRVDGQDLALFRPQWRMPALARYLKWPEDAIGLVGFERHLPRWVADDGQPHTVEVLVAATRVPLQGSGTRVVQHLPAHQRLAPPCQMPATPAQVTVVVLNRNGARVLDALLRSWEQHNRQVGAEWVVVDHASTDGSLALLQRWQQRLPLQVQALQENRSFSASCNLGARVARTPYLLFLNNDLVWQQDALPVMLQTLQQPDVCAVGMKLLKVSELAQGATWSEVQHLGVRFTLHHETYMPYEANPLNSPGEHEHAAQDVPVVTGAALLCRSDEFWAAGGFHESYFYGFEDVELCLRLAQRTGKRVVCRNDLVALHRHGYTRLTGREPAVLERLQHNEAVLQQEVGLWLKRAWWHSLLAQDRGLCPERLQVGIWAGTRPGRSRLARIQAMAQHLQTRYTGVCVWLMDARSNDRYDARDMHVLLVAAPDCDVHQLKNARADLRVVAWIDQPADVPAWLESPHWATFDAYLAPSAATAQRLHRLTGCSVDVTSAGEPLPGLARCRVRLTAGHTPTARRRAAELRGELKAHGVACWIDTRDMPHRRLVEIKVHVGSREPDVALDGACLNVWWRLGTRTSPPPQLPWDWVTHQTPDTAPLLQALEKKIGRTFYSP